MNPSLSIETDIGRKESPFRGSKFHQGIQEQWFFGPRFTQGPESPAQKLTRIRPEEEHEELYSQWSVEFQLWLQ